MRLAHFRTGWGGAGFLWLRQHLRSEVRNGCEEGERVFEL